MESLKAKEMMMKTMTKQPGSPAYNSFIEPHAVFVLQLLHVVFGKQIQPGSTWLWAFRSLDDFYHLNEDQQVKFWWVGGGPCGISGVVPGMGWRSQSRSSGLGVPAPGRLMMWR